MLLYIVEWGSNVKKVYLQTSILVGNGNKLQQNYCVVPANKKKTVH